MVPAGVSPAGVAPADGVGLPVSGIDGGPRWQALPRCFGPIADSCYRLDPGQPAQRAAPRRGLPLHSGDRRAAGTAGGTLTRATDT
jgi:hypothetical protein